MDLSDTLKLYQKVMEQSYDNYVKFWNSEKSKGIALKPLMDYEEFSKSRWKIYNESKKIAEYNIITSIEMSKFQVPNIQNPKKQIAPSTLKLYKSQLNKLAVLGYSNINILQEKPDEVVKAINTLLKGKDNYAFRLMYSTIFYVLSDTEYTKSENPYRADFTKHRDPIVQDA
jgi:hypothetical protein